MYRGMRISVVIPCLNEEEGIMATLKAVPDYVDEVLVVDNNSKDRSAEVARRMGARVIFEPQRGYGRAYKRGLSQVSSDIIVTADADGTYPVDAISQLVDEIIDRGVDFISGCRFPLKDRKVISFKNYIGNRILTRLMSLLFSYQIRDSLSGMWAFKQEVLQHLKMSCDDICFTQEIKMEAIMSEEVKFDELWIDYGKRMGKSKLGTWNNGIRCLLFLIKRRFFTKGK